MRDVTVCIPSLRQRAALLGRALKSVVAQTEKPAHVGSIPWEVSYDDEGLGAAQNRNRAWRAATTTWIAFLDDDDELLPHHVEHCLDVAEATGADLVYPWHRIVGKYGETKPDLLAGQGVAFDPAELESRNFIPVTVLVKREWLERVDGFPQPMSEEWPHPDCEDWGCWKRLVAAGATFVHTPEITWLWHHHGFNTSGRAEWAAQLPGERTESSEQAFTKVRQGGGS